MKKRNFKSNSSIMPGITKLKKKPMFFKKKQSNMSTMQLMYLNF